MIKTNKKSSTISSKGQITVPQEVRTRMGLRPGDRVEFVMEDGATTLRPARAEGNPFEKYAGALPAFADADAIRGWIRELRDEEPAREKRR